MKDFLNKFFADPIFSSLLTVIAGILTVVFSKYFIDIVSIVLGCFSFILGLVNVVKYFNAPLEGKYNLLTGLLFGILGLTIVFKPDMLGDLVAVVLGIIILYHGIINAENSLLIKKAEYKFWYLSLVFALLTGLAGIIVIVLRNEILDYLAIVIGVTLIVEGALNTWTGIKLKSITNG